LFYLKNFILMNLYIGNLNYRIRESELQSALEQFGEVISLRVVKDRDTGRSKGFGFAEFADADAAKQAIENLNGKEFDGRPLVLKEASPRS
jgi:RNA recognition motif-containing protein